MPSHLEEDSRHGYMQIVATVSGGTVPHQFVQSLGALKRLVAVELMCQRIPAELGTLPHLKHVSLWSLRGQTTRQIAELARHPLLLPHLELGASYA